MKLVDHGDGWPPDEAPGTFIGMDAAGHVAVLWWTQMTADSIVPATWHGLRYVEGADTKIWPQGFRRGEGTEDYVIRHARVVNGE